MYNIRHFLIFDYTLATLDMVFNKNCNSSGTHDNTEPMKNTSITLTIVAVLYNDMKVSLRVDQSSFNAADISWRIAIKTSDVVWPRSLRRFITPHK